MSRKEKGKKQHKQYISTFGEEIANATSHGAMFLLSLFLIPFSAVWSYEHGDMLASVGVSIFVISLFFMFMSSTLYHSMTLDSKHKKVFKVLDHIAIYFAIAGSYTPIALSVIGGWQGWVIIAIQWVIVLFGIFYKSLLKRSIPKLSLTMYLVMGWTVVLFLPMFLAKADMVLLWLIVAGGICYTIGAFFYALKGFKFHHMVWHLFINIAATLHFIGIVFFLYR